MLSIFGFSFNAMPIKISFAVAKKLCKNLSKSRLSDPFFGLISVISELGSVCVCVYVCAR